ncbi:hypothetical protein H2199_002817 [Coniosporium tulheliwenetii]|uniref:Uncharacterized protein n=1 Tax=Coniosporium tulheliwenetii TaxID=3383036 RepID=A0ACC2ZD87_9PEZI|nr:hypothetical protein H2199_002817 [Cladosporium sp. JES 115]
MSPEVKSEHPSMSESSDDVSATLNRAHRARARAAAAREEAARALNRNPKEGKERLGRLTEEISRQEIDMELTRQEVQDGPTKRLHEHMEAVPQALQYLLCKIEQLEKKNEDHEDRLAVQHNSNLSLEREIRQMRKDCQLSQLSPGVRKLLFEESQASPT